MIIVSPYSKKLLSGKQNPKNYPFWKSLIHLFSAKYQIIQIGIEGEEKLVNDFRKNIPLEEIKKLLSECEFWMSPDNFLPHLAHHVKKPGAVLWSVSDPNIFGYPENLNILKDRKYIRPNQFDMYDNTPYNIEAFVKPDEVLIQVSSFFGT